jgi:magnesium transporter
MLGAALRESWRKQDMPRLAKKRARKVGVPPGALVHASENKIAKTRIILVNYDEMHLEEREIKALDESIPFVNQPTVTWVNVEGLHQAGVLEKLGECFGLHPLAVEDILNFGERPKMEDFGGYILIVLKIPYHYNNKSNEIETGQISLVLGPNFVISLQERAGDVFRPIREQIKNGKGRVRKSGADFLAYALVDSIVDTYFTVLEQIGESMESMEDEVVTNPVPETLQIIHDLKREMILMRKSVWPFREIVGRLERVELPLIQDSTKIFLSDVYDHTIEVIDTVETFRDMLSSMLDIYLSSVSNKTNEVMKVLTIIATIFIPLALIPGIYGMNFKYMPELGWRWGYPMVWLVMIGIGALMLIYFRKKKWL